MLTLLEIQDIAGRVSFRDWSFEVSENNGIPFMQIFFYDNDSISGERELQSCRIWQLSYEMVPSEVVRTAHKAVLSAVEHEANEFFTYNGERIYNPHFDLDKMVAFAKAGNISART